MQVKNLPNSEIAFMASSITFLKSEYISLLPLGKHTSEKQKKNKKQKHKSRWQNDSYRMKDKSIHESFLVENQANEDEHEFPRQSKGYSRMSGYDGTVIHVLLWYI